jgi:hypothetical protein
MSRYKSYSQLDTQKSFDGDFSFRGIDMKHDRPLLESGMVAKSINKRLRTGIAETRPGTRLPADFNPAFAQQFRGSFIYSNPNGNESMLIAEQGRSFVWELRYGQTPKQVPITGGGTAIGTQTVWFVQAFDKVLLLRGGLTPLEWDGLSYTVGFKPIVKFDPADTSTNLIPNVNYGIPFQNRILYVYGNDQILMSDVLDYTSYDPLLANFRINAGEADRIISVHPYSKESVLVFMNRSIHRFSNFTIDPNLASQEIVSDELGTVGREAVVQVGADMIFLSRQGFYRVNQVFDNQTVSAPVPISDLISPLLEGINWADIDNTGYASMEMLGDYCHMGVPIGRNFPRNLLLYNTVTSQWESLDAWEDSNFFVNALRVTIFDGERRLFGINNVNHHVYLLYEGITDQTGVTNSVNDILETRGYLTRNQYGQQVGFDIWKRFDRLTLSIRTRNPSVSVNALTDGYNEIHQITLAPITKRTDRFYLFGVPFPYPLSSGPSIPYREDYYTGSETEWVGQDMSNLLPGNIDLLPAVDAEMAGGPTTESMERRAMRVRGRWCSIRIENTQGYCAILGCSVDVSEVRSDSLTTA